MLFLLGLVLWIQVYVSINALYDKLQDNIEGGSFWEIINRLMKMQDCCESRNVRKGSWCQHSSETADRSWKQEVITRKWGDGGKERNKGLLRTSDKESSTSRRDLNKRNVGRFRDRRNINKWLGDDYPEISHSGLVMGMEVPKRQLGLLVKRWQKVRLGNNFEKLWRETCM